MEFGTKQEAYDFYNNYAHDVGFSIRRSKGFKEDMKPCLDRKFCCSCHGIRGNEKRDDNVK